MKDEDRAQSWLGAAASLFLGSAPRWYKLALLAALVVNPFVVWLAGPFVGGWLILIEFVGALALALRCYPLQPGGLLAIQAVLLGLAGADDVYREVEHNLSVILLLMFMVAGIYFLRDLLMFLFSRLLVAIRPKAALSALFCAVSAVLSAFLDALTVMAVIVTVSVGFFSVYHKVASGRGFDDDHDHEDDTLVHDPRQGDLARFRSFLRSLVMHAAVGTALGGISTMVGEPQNLVIAKAAGWGFVEFALRMLPISLLAFGAGLVTCVVLERTRTFGYGELLPESVREVLERFVATQDATRTPRHTVRLAMQAVAALVLVVGLLFHVAEVGLIGLLVIVLATSLTGVVEEKRLGHAFEEALPFTALLVAFFAVVAVIDRQQLFRPVIDYVLKYDGTTQVGMMYAANGVLSAISDNVFVATVYVKELEAALASGVIDRPQFERLAIAVNAGTNLPSVATPNGQAAFLFLLTSALAPLIRLGYGRMVWMALPYTIVLGVAGLLATLWWT
ncbi:MAG TPA: sodium/proton antiporter NhaB [Xanthomonadales bacterium]|nr:sodium/proton antiporter NhaB [Xanthomonadales bacterium]